MKDTQYRKDFVRNLGELFTTEGAFSHGETCGIDHMEYNDDETVTIYYRDGAKTIVNVAMDSLAAIAYDVMDAML